MKSEERKKGRTAKGRKVEESEGMKVKERRNESEERERRNKRTKRTKGR